MMSNRHGRYAYLLICAACIALIVCAGAPPLVRVLLGVLIVGALIYQISRDVRP